MNERPVPHQYYDVYDVLKYLKLNSINELIPFYEEGLEFITTERLNEMKQSYQDNIGFINRGGMYEGDIEEEKKELDNYEKCLNELGECTINVWW